MFLSTLDTGGNYSAVKGPTCPLESQRVPGLGLQSRVGFCGLGVSTQIQDHMYCLTSIAAVRRFLPAPSPASELSGCHAPDVLLSLEMLPTAKEIQRTW